MKWFKNLLIVLLLVVLTYSVFGPSDYYLINFNTKKFPEIRWRLPVWFGESFRLITDDVENWEEHTKRKLDTKK